MAGLGRQGDAVGHHLEQVDVGVAEVPGGEGADVQHAQEPPARKERDAEQRADALGAEHGIDDVRVGDVLDGHGFPAAATRPANPLPRGIRNPWWTSSSMPAGRRGHELAGRHVEQEDGGGVGVEDVPHPIEQLDQ